MSRNKRKPSYQTNNNRRTLKCVFLLMVSKFGTSLKLTPVQHPTRKIELDLESKSVTHAFNEAKEFIVNETNTFSETGVSVTLHTRAIRKLHSAIERWNMIEERLRTAISTSDQVPPEILFSSSHSSTYRKFIFKTSEASECVRRDTECYCR
jgi:hypothetical protein